MRLSAIALALGALVALSGCGDEQPEQIDAGPQRPAPQRPAVDTALGDTVAVAGGREPGAADRAGGPDGDAGGEPPRPTGGAAADDGAAESKPAGQRLYTVQVAAFTSPDSAAKWTGRLSRLDLPVWTSMTESGGRTYYRVRVGAVPTVGEARRLGGILSERFEWPVWVAPVSPSERIPEEAVADTRRLLGGE